MTAAGLFVLFALLERGVLVGPIRSLSTASFLAAVGAGSFAYRYPRQVWRWGLLLSSAFSVFLVIVFFLFASQGQLDWWPLADASIIVGAACAGAFIARALSHRAVNGATEVEGGIGSTKSVPRA
jgi:Ca2+/Na+ antiporter